MKKVSEIQTNVNKVLKRTLLEQLLKEKSYILVDSTDESSENVESDEDNEMVEESDSN